MNKTFFYIIQRNGTIHEIEYTPERFAGAFTEWQKGGLIAIPSMGLGINAVDISNIFDADKYETFIDTARPKLFIRNGTWYDIGEKKPVRHEKWKQDEIDNRLKLEAENERTGSQCIGEFCNCQYTKNGHAPEFIKELCRKAVLRFPTMR